MLTFPSGASERGLGEALVLGVWGPAPQWDTQKRNQEPRVLSSRVTPSTPDGIGVPDSSVFFESYPGRPLSA